MYLNPKIYTLEAILTNVGRQKLAENNGSFRITQFALGDDEIDYTLYNPNHPSGSAYFGEAIEATPLFEAFPDESQIMNSRLITVKRGTAKLPVISVGFDPIILKQGAQIPISPQTLNFSGQTTTYEASGYSLTIHDSRLLSSLSAVGVTDTNFNSTIASTGGSFSKTVTGTAFTLTATTLDSLFTNTSSLTTTITITGLDSGAKITVGLLIQKS